MKVKDIIRELRKFDPETRFLVINVDEVRKDNTKGIYQHLELSDVEAEIEGEKQTVVAILFNDNEFEGFSEN